jgi:hypothetical protein
MLMSVPNETLDKRWVQACVAVEAGEVSAAKVVPGGGAMGGSPVIAYTNDFRDAEDVLRAGLALRARFGDKAAVKLLYKPDVFTLCDPERLFETGPRGGKRPIPKCPYQLLPGAFELKVVSKSLTLAKEMAVEPWARRMAAEDDEKPTGTGTEDGTHRAVAGGRSDALVGKTHVEKKRTRVFHEDRDAADAHQKCQLARVGRTSRRARSPDADGQPRVRLSARARARARSRALAPARLRPDPRVRAQRAHRAGRHRGVRHPRLGAVRARRGRPA